MPRTSGLFVFLLGLSPSGVVCLSCKFLSLVWRQGSHAGIDEAIRGVQRLKKSPHLFMETYHKSMAGLERRRSRINLQFMLEMRKLEEDDEFRFEEEYNVWLSDEPLTNDEICQLMRGVERERKLEGKPPLVSFSRSKRPKKTPKKTEGVYSSHKLTGSPTPASRVESTVPEDANA